MTFIGWQFLPENNIETEISLLIKTANPHEITKTLQAFRELGEYRLYHPNTLRIHDIYIDTQQDSLRAKRFALRIRETETNRFLTLKGPPKRIQSGAVERLEIEEPFSRENFAKIADILSESNVTISGVDTSTTWENPFSLIESLEFRVIQDRTTVRAVRKIAPKDKIPLKAHAELAIDRVEYRITGKSLFHHEVEIELISRTERDVLAEVAAALKLRFRDSLIDWEHNKLVTGQAIEELFRAGSSKSLTDSQSNLKPSTYDKIDKLLRSAHH